MNPASNKERRSFMVSVSTADLPAFRAAMAHAAFATADTGERVTTDAGPDAETLLVVTVPREACTTTAERKAALLRP